MTLTTTMCKLYQNEMLQVDFIFGICQTNPTKVAFVHSLSQPFSRWFFLFFSSFRFAIRIANTRDSQSNNFHRVYSGIFSYFGKHSLQTGTTTIQFNCALVQKSDFSPFSASSWCRAVVRINEFDVSLSSQVSSSVFQSARLNPERCILYTLNECRQSPHLLYKPIPTYQLTPPPPEGLT